MEDLKKNIVINCDKKEEENFLIIKIKYYPINQNSTLYKKLFYSENIDLQTLKSQLDEQMYTVVTLTNEIIKIKTNGGVLITAERYEENEKILEYIDDNLKFNKKAFTDFLNSNNVNKIWVKVGKLEDLENIILNYPFTNYIYGMIYNNRSIEEVVISTWNRGTRVFFPRMIPHGDNAGNFHSGTAIFTKDTDDNESKGRFCHRYVNSNFAPCCGSNANANNLDVYVKKL